MKLFDASLIIIIIAVTVGCFVLKAVVENHADDIANTAKLLYCDKIR